MPLTRIFKGTDEGLIPQSKLPWTRSMSSDTSSKTDMSTQSKCAVEASNKGFRAFYGEVLPRKLEGLPQFIVTDVGIGQWNGLEWQSPRTPTHIPQVGSESWPHVYLCAYENNEIIYKISYAPSKIRRFCFWHPVLGWMPEIYRPFLSKNSKVKVPSEVSSTKANFTFLQET